ncbi:TrkA C-terminal domain protein [Porphyromonas uenonis 60-3]|uniref:TrkA C-terminal domain protein n=1 Tax=Porphyromonas uenonis 60-3 TaxID=596327 RepID=C2MCS6_9PORP|nr:putative transporter [Porphyromonas uenonis]EEK16505.1 TrkA C-terminal domain protein [Porphyromonas uenonis 60-3]
MNWFANLFVGSGIAHSVFLIALVIAVGMLLGRIKIGKVSLGVTLVLFVGIFFGALGMQIEPGVLHFVKEFGLILFIYAVGLQVGPGFFPSLKKGGLKLNLLAVLVVMLGVGVTIAIKYISGLPMSTMVGILSGAVTNTPGLGAAEQTYSDIMGTSDPSIAMGYAVAYPLGVIGIILSMMVVRSVLRVNIRKEEQNFVSQDDALEHTARSASFVVANPAVFGKSIMELLSSYFNQGEIVVSRHYCHETHRITVAKGDTILQEHDRVFVIGQPHELDHSEAIFGQRIEVDRKNWIPTESNLISNKYTITKKTLNGKRLGELQLRQIYGVNVTRVTRAGVDLVAHPSMRLQMGDQIRVVGSDASVNKVRELVGDSQKHLNEPNLIGIFIGIAIGVLFGSIPFAFPGIPQPIKLGLAGGPLIVAILLSNFGPKFGLVTYTTHSANLMIREIGIALFLTCVGIGAGDGFVDTIVNGGYHWVGYGFIITIIPMLIVGLLGKKLFKVNYLTLSGLMAGSMTDPPALAYANGLTEEDAPAVGYATVYPLTMFLRVLTAQMLIIFFVS